MGVHRTRGEADKTESAATSLNAERVSSSFLSFLGPPSCQDKMFGECGPGIVPGHNVTCCAGARCTQNEAAKVFESHGGRGLMRWLDHTRAPTMPTMAWAVSECGEAGPTRVANHSPKIDPLPCNRCAGADRRAPRVRAGQVAT